VVGWRRGRTWWLAAAALFLASTSLIACSSGVQCSQRAPDYAIVGTLITRKGSTATFVVESLQPPSTARSGHSAGPVPVIGQRVDVRYYSGERFLRVGTRYRVAMSWNSGVFESAVHTADVPCSGGTTHANGTAIDTSWWKQHSWVLMSVYVFAALPLVVVAVGIATFSTRRRRKRADTQAT
jgi:hypothetical protein